MPYFDEAECWFDDATVDDIEIDGIEDPWAANIEVTHIRKVDIIPVIATLIKAT